jgi:hypothetical protein
MTVNPDNISQKQARRQLRKDLFISVLAFISLGIGFYDLSHVRTTTQFCWYDIMDLVIVGIFIIDFIWSAVGSGNWRAYARRHWYEIPSLLPITGNMVFGAEGRAHFAKLTISQDGPRDEIITCDWCCHANSCFLEYRHSELRAGHILIY